MNWSAKLLDGDRPEAPLDERIDALFAAQRVGWPALAEGEAALASLETKALEAEDGRILVQANPGRRRSTHAKVDAQSVAERPCFLCPANMPTEERGIAWRHLVILPNPYPILPRHSTIPSREHAPQRLAGRVQLLLELAQAAGPELAVFYNGPRCGASAPDHFHFQACDGRALPVFETELRGQGRERRASTSFGRAIVLFASPDLADVAADLNATLDVLSRSASPGEEPKINLVATIREGRIVAALFPRSAHRPSCYFALGADRVAISPAALEMSGVLVVAEPEHFSRVDAAVARRIYQEVSFNAAQFDELVEDLARRQIILER